MSRARTWRSITAGPKSARSIAGTGGRTGPPQVAVIVTAGHAAAVAAKAATQTIPIVFHLEKTRSDLVWSPVSPGRAAIDGSQFFHNEVNAKRLGLLRELVPAATRVAMLINPINAPNTSSTLKDVEPAARALGLQIQIFHASTGLEIDAAFAALVPDAARRPVRRPGRLLHQPAGPNCRAGCAPRAASELFGARPSSRSVD